MVLILPEDRTARNGKPRKKHARNCINGEMGNGSFTLCGVRYVQKNDYSVKMDQQEFTAKLSTAEFNRPKNLHKLNGKTNWMQQVWQLSGELTDRYNGWWQIPELTSLLRSLSPWGKHPILQLRVYRRRTKLFDRPRKTTRYRFTFMQYQWINWILEYSVMLRGEFVLMVLPKVDIWYMHLLTICMMVKKRLWELSTGNHGSCPGSVEAASQQNHKRWEML